MTDFGTLEQRRNFFDTFGYLTFPLPTDFPYPKLQAEFEHAAATFLKKPYAEVAESRMNCSIAAFADQSVTASAFLVEHLDDAFKSILGPSYIFLGSDGSIFFGHGTPWHRDLAFKLPAIKFNVYIDFDSQGDGGTLLILPGSHHLDSTYSSLLQRSLAWPAGSMSQGGLAESGFLPPGLNPAEAAFSLHHDTIPHMTIPIREGMAMAFHTSAIHSVHTEFSPEQPRRLVTFICCAHPADLASDHFAIQRDGRPLSADDLLDEVYTLKAFTFLRLGIDRYGEALMQYPDYIKAHGLDWERIKSRAAEMSGVNRETGKTTDVQMSKMADLLLRNIAPRSNGLRDQ